MPVSTIYAENNQAQLNPFQKLQLFIYDVHESLIFNPITKAQLETRHALEIQETINKLSDSNQQIPQELDQKRLEKLATAQQIIQTNNADDHTINALQSVQQKLVELGELNKIRIKYSEMDGVLERNDPLEKAQFNQEINSLQTWKSNCSGQFDINEYQKDIDSFEKLSNTHCQNLKKLNFQEIKNFIISKTE